MFFRCLFVGPYLVVHLFFVVFIVFFFVFPLLLIPNSCSCVVFWLSSFFVVTGFLWFFCCFSLVFMFAQWFSMVFIGILNSHENWSAF